MHSHLTPLLSTFSPVEDITLLRVEASRMAAHAMPGQFVMARVAGEGWDPLLREPLLIVEADPQVGAVTLWIPLGSPIRDRLRALPLSATLDLLGPFGNGAPPRDGVRNLLVAGEGMAVGVLLGAMQQASTAGQTVTVLLAVPDGESPFPADALPFPVEYQVTTRESLSTVAPELVRWADGVLAAGSLQFYHKLMDVLRGVRPRARAGTALGLMLEPFGWQTNGSTWGAARAVCGVWACSVCRYELRRERVLACRHGPVFDLALA